MSISSLPSACVCVMTVTHMAFSFINTIMGGKQLWWLGVLHYCCCISLQWDHLNPIPSFRKTFFKPPFFPFTAYSCTCSAPRPAFHHLPGVFLSLLSSLRLHPLSHISSHIPGLSLPLYCTQERALVSAASCLTKDPSVSPLCVASAASPPPSSTPLWYIPSLSPGAFLIHLGRRRSTSVSAGVSESGAGRSCPGGAILERLSL